MINVLTKPKIVTKTLFIAKAQEYKNIECK